MCDQALDDELFVCGGYDGVESLHTAEAYCSASNTWTTRTSMLRRRSACGAVQLGAQVIAVGGHDGLSIFDSVRPPPSFSSPSSRAPDTLCEGARRSVSQNECKFMSASFALLFIHSFLHSFIPSFIHSFIHSFIRTSFGVLSYGCARFSFVAARGSAGAGTSPRRSDATMVASLRRGIAKVQCS